MLIRSMKKSMRVCVHWCQWMSNTLLKHIVAAVILGGIPPVCLLDHGAIVIDQLLVLVTFFVGQDVFPVRHVVFLLHFLLLILPQ